MSSKITFSSEDDLTLAELVGYHPCLYDLKHSLYKDQTVRENVWKQISNEVKPGIIIKLHNYIIFNTILYFIILLLLNSIVRLGILHLYYIILYYNLFFHTLPN